MGASQHLSSLSCEIRIIRAKNIELKPSQSLFVRYYLSAGDNRRIQLNTRKIPSKYSNDVVWDESFSLDCFGTVDSMHSLKQGTVVFELRYRNTVPVLGRIGRSHLLGRAEIPWKTVFEAPEMEIEKWVQVREGVEGPAVQVAMKARVPAPERSQKNGRRANSSGEGCGCRNGDCAVGGCCYVDYELFALAAVLKGL